jgi:hypothetical protein
MFGNQKPQSIYTHTHLDMNSVNKIKPLMENAFASPLGEYSGNRDAIRKEKIDFLSKQYANRSRIANNMGTTPLYEDAAIFGHIPQIKQLFESVSTPGNGMNMGNVSNPANGTSQAGGFWNPAYQPGSGDIPSYVFGLQSHIAMHCIGFDLMPTIAVDTPKVVINYVDTVYGGGPMDDAENQPSYIELASSVFTAAWVKTSNLRRATTELILIGSDLKALKVRFMIASTVKAAITVEVLATGTVDVITSAAVFTATNALSVKQVIDSINATIASAKVVIAGVSATALATTTAHFASATRTNIAEAASNNNSAKGMNRSQHEKGPKHKLNVISMDKQLEMDGIEIEADTSNIQIKDLAAQGINVIARLYNGVQNQLVQTLDEIIMNHLYALGVEHAVGTYRSQGINHSLYIAAPANTTKAFSAIDVKFEDMLDVDVRTDMGSITNSIQSSGYENQMTHADRLYARLLLVSEFIAQQNRIGGPDFVVLGGALAACLKKNAKFQTSPTTNTLSASPELHYSGTVFETINVYKNPRISFSDPRILLGRRGNDTDPGAKFLAYDLAASRQMIVEGTMAEKIRVWSRFKIADVGFYPEINYYTMVAINEYNWN